MDEPVAVERHGAVLAERDAQQPGVPAPQLAQRLLRLGDARQQVGHLLAEDRMGDQREQLLVRLDT